MNFDVNNIRKDFPVLSGKVYGKPLVYFDNAATTQKPQVVIDTLRDIYEHSNSSIHRGVHFLSDQMTNRYEEARDTVKSFIHAASKEEIIFTSGATESINLVAFSYGEKYVSPGDEVIVSGQEHHANIVPWQLLCERKQARLKVIPLLPDGEIDMEAFSSMITPLTRIVAVTHASNVLANLNPVDKIISLAHAQQVPVLIDASQSVQHIPVDVSSLDCDFLVFSGHKIYAPTGIGVLYGKRKWLDSIPPYKGGGDMVDRVSFEQTTFNVLPFKFEAGTTNYTGAIALARALQYLEEIGMQTISAQEASLTEYMMQKLTGFQGITIYNQKIKGRGPVFSFNFKGIHPFDIGMLLDKMGIAIRTGTHCAQPLLDHFGVDASARASLCFYNTKDEIDTFCKSLERAVSMLT